MAKFQFGSRGPKFAADRCGIISSSTGCGDRFRRDPMNSSYWPPFSFIFVYYTKNPVGSSNFGRARPSVLGGSVVRHSSGGPSRTNVFFGLSATFSAFGNNTPLNGYFERKLRRPSPPLPPTVGSITSVPRTCFFVFRKTYRSGGGIRPTIARRPI